MNEFFMIISGIGGLIAFIILVFVLPSRISEISKDIIELKRTTIKHTRAIEQIETIKGIAAGYLQGKTCVKCGIVFTTDVHQNKLRCPHCDIIYSSNYLIVRNLKTGEIENYVKEYFEKKEDKLSKFYERIN